MAESRAAARGNEGRRDAPAPYYGLFKQAPFPIALFDASGRWVEANDAFRASIGDDPPPGYNLLADEANERKGTMRDVRRAFAGETVRFPPQWDEAREVWMARGKAAPRVAFERTLFPIRGEGGAVSHVALCLRDVTAQLLRQEKRDEQASRVLESALVGVWVFDPNGETIFMNRRMASMLGVTPEEGATMPIAELVAPEIRPKLQERLAARKAGTAATGEQRFPRPDGTEGWAMFESGPMFDADGRFEGIVATVVDISERRRAEEALRQSERRFRRLAEGGTLGILVTDLDGRILDANDTFLGIVGYSRDDLFAGRLRWTDLTPLEWRHLDDRAAEQLRTAGVAPTWEKEYVRKDGSRVPILVGVTAIDPATGECIAFVLDQTERKRAQAALRVAEAQLRQAHKMEAVGRLAGGIAHDFNNLLSVILSYSDALIAGWDPASAADDIAQIRKAALRAAELTRQLLAFSRQQVLELRPVNVNAVVQNLLGLLTRVLGASVEVQAALADDLWGATADAAQLEQVLVNLVLNARDAMPTGGTLGI
ncbi:MAG: PAS domain S-box protein, partial [Myxococcales bacterium]|nr:PAS domain S-box protein [Myxococcales bacterium]